MTHPTSLRFGLLLSNRISDPKSKAFRNDRRKTETNKSRVLECYIGTCNLYSYRGYNAFSKYHGHPSSVLYPDDLRVLAQVVCKPWGFACVSST